MIEWIVAMTAIEAYESARLRLEAQKREAERERLEWLVIKDQSPEVVYAYLRTKEMSKRNELLRRHADAAERSAAAAERAARAAEVSARNIRTRYLFL